MLVALGLFFIVLCTVPATAAWGSSDESILLKDVEVLTLYNGKMTKGKRSSPVPQLMCVKGGTAPCDAFHPRVVQCYNRGWDGLDVQWECKTDMDNAFRFGEIEVSCEGYSHKDDPFILKGSCGLRYSIDYTKEGLNQKQGYHNYYGDQNTGYGNSHQAYGTEKSSYSTIFANIIVLIAFALMCWAFYVSCFRSSRNIGQDAYSNTNDDYPAGGGGGGGGYGWFGSGGTAPSAPPPPGYRDDASCRNRTSGAATGSGGAGGFWTGAATGGLLGYMFGARGNNGGYRQQRPWSSGWGSHGGGFSSSHHSGGGGGSTGTRGASGFGGTSRR